jgi:hypothetical protein
MISLNISNYNYISFLVSYSTYVILTLFSLNIIFHHPLELICSLLITSILMQLHSTLF